MRLFKIFVGLNCRVSGILIFLYSLTSLSVTPNTLTAQRVIYSESFNNRLSNSFRVIGNSAGYYWVEKQYRKYAAYSKSADQPVIQNMSLLDSKLNVMNEFAAPSIPGMVKQWMLAGPDGMDQVVVVQSDKKTKILRRHYPIDGREEIQLIPIVDFSFAIHPSKLILVRSEDQSKLLLLAFENTNDLYDRIHVIQFYADWKQIYHQVIHNEPISQPCIQDDEIGFASESFDNLPVKLMNNGEWVMAFTSPVGNHFSLLHNCADGNQYTIQEIPLLPYYKMEDIAMSVDNKKQEMNLGFLCTYKRSALKGVQVLNYSLSKGFFNADTSYRFTTRAGNIATTHLTHDRFMSMPGGGFMLMKEYGSNLGTGDQSPLPLNPWETAYLLADYKPSKTNERAVQTYTSNTGLSPIPFVKNRGDLNLFFFPAASADSSWSGILDLEQHADLNNPDLSYLMIPKEDKLLIIYNNLSGQANPVPMSTALNLHGESSDDPLVFWEIKKQLNFQQARRISVNETAVEYQDRRGFALIINYQFH